MMNPRRPSLAFAALALLGAPVCLRAGSFVTGFNSGLPPGSALFGTSVVSPNDGTGGGYTNSGCLQLSGALGGLGGAFIITNDLDGGTPVVSFTAAFKVLMAGGDAAAGVSFNFAPDLPMAPISMDGAGSGLTVEFDTLIDGATEPAPAIDVKVAGTAVASAFCEGLQAGSFVDALIQLNPNNRLDVVYDGVYVYSNLDLNTYGYAPAAGSLFGFGSVTAATNDDHFIDNLSIVTSTTPAPYIQSFAPRGRQVQTNSAIDIVLEDDRTLVDTTSVALTLDGAAVSPVITTNGVETRLHFVPPSGFVFASAHAVNLAFADNAGPAPQQFTWNYGFTVANPPFVPGAYTTLFSDGFEAYALGALDKNPMYYPTDYGAPGSDGPNYAPNGSGNPWFGPTPPNAQVVTAEVGVTPHSGDQMLGGLGPGEESTNWCNLAYRVGGGQYFTSNCLLDWWFYDPLGNAPNAADFEDYVALCSYNTAPTNTDYPESSTPENNGNLNAGLVISSQYQRLSLGASVFMPAYGAYNSSHYQARIAGASLGYGQGWIDTPSQRSVGWHHARIILGPLLPDGTVNVYFYIDDLVTPVYSGNSINSSGFNVIEVNSAQADAVGYFDDISFAVATATTPASLSVALAGKRVVLSWQGGSLQSAPRLTGPWNLVPGATSPYPYDPASAPVQFFRLLTATTPPSSLAIARAGKTVVLSWQGASTLQSAPSLAGPWGNVTGATSPYPWDPASAPRQFFRLRN
jgi:hypothetical protein